LGTVTFESAKDMHPAVFDFAQNNGLKTLQLNQNKILKLFLEMTKK
jgi:ABC-2 type transport system ATP-binding protein